MCSGAVIAMTISQGVSPLFVLMYMWSCGLHRQTWGGWSWEAMMDWWPFIKLAIPGLLMVGFEWWSYEIGGLALGAISKTQQAIHLNILNINAVLFLVRPCVCCMGVVWAWVWCGHGCVLAWVSTFTLEVASVHTFTLEVASVHTFTLEVASVHTFNWACDHLSCGQVTWHVIHASTTVCPGHRHHREHSCWP